MKNKIVKLFISMLITLSVISGYVANIYAASYSVSVSTRSVTSGGTVKVTVNGSGCEGSFAISVNNGASVTGQNPIWTGESSTVKAGSSNFVITVTPKSLADSNTGQSIKLSSKSISISIKSSGGKTPSGGANPPSGGTSTSSGGSTSTVVDNRSKDNNLSSLSISSGTLSPAFSSSKTSYTVDLTSEVESLTINAKAKDSKAKVSGTGKKALKIGTQAFEVVVTAENGSKKSYTINVNVKEKPTVFTQFGETKLGLLKSTHGIEVPNGFVGTTVELEGQSISAWANETSGLTLVYLMDEKENKNFYIFEDGKVSKKYETIKVNGSTYTLVNTPKDLKGVEGLIAGKTKINDIQIDGWSYDDEIHKNYSIVYLMNSDGKANLYSYEATEGTLQLYTAPVEDNSLNTMTYIFMATTGILAVTSIAGFVMYFRFKKKSIAAIKDYYERKNQG